MPVLGKKGFETAARTLSIWPSLALPALEACRQGGPGVPQKLTDEVVYFIRSNPAGMLDASAVANSSPATLEEILQDQKIVMNEFELFSLVRLWLDTRTEGDEEHRRSIAMKLVDQHIRLERIAPDNLEKQVAESGLVTEKQVNKAYKKQAFEAWKFHGTDFQSPRSLVLPFWSNSKSVVAGDSSSFSRGIDYLEDTYDCPFFAGKYQWTLEVQDARGDICVGVVSDMDDSEFSAFSGYQNGNLICKKLNVGDWSTSVSTILDGSDLPTFTTGSRVTLTLDTRNLCFSEDSYRTPLNICMEGGNPDGVTIPLLRSANFGGVVPAVRITGGGRVRLWAMQELSE